MYNREDAKADLKNWLDKVEISSELRPHLDFLVNQLVETIESESFEEGYEAALEEIQDSQGAIG